MASSISGGSGNAIDYFATLGKPPGKLICQSFPLTLDEDSPPLSADEVWFEAITEIVLVSPTDTLPEPDTWTILSESWHGTPLEFPHIAFRRRHAAPRPDHICELRFLQPGEIIPNDFEVIRFTANGRLSGLLKPGYLAFKRTQKSLFIDDSKVLYDICVLKKHSKDEFPDKYQSIGQKENTTFHFPSSFSSNNDFILGVRYLPSLGICNQGYLPTTLDRYPLIDHHGVELPMDVLPLFAFPRHLRLEVQIEYPLPIFFTFVFTDANGRQTYAACLQFYEKIDYNDLPDLYSNEVIQLAKQMIRKNIESDSSVASSWGLEPGVGIFCPKVICVLSRVPFYRAMRRYLRHVYSLSLSSSICPLPYFITSVVGQIPLPIEGGRPFHAILDAALISRNSKPMPPIVFELPPAYGFPFMDLDFAGPLRCFSVNTLLAVFALMLRESKMVFVSCSNTILTEAMETLRMLLFPLTWVSTFVSRLPQSLSGLLHAPGGFLIGIHVEQKEWARNSSDRPTGKEGGSSSEKGNSEKTSSSTTSGSGGNGENDSSMSSQTNAVDATRNFVRTMHFDYPMVPGTYVLDLAANKILIFNGRSTEPLSGSQVSDLVQSLPKGPRIRLMSRLRSIAEEYEIGPQRAGLEEFDSAFDFQSSVAMNIQHWESFPTLMLRDSFASFMMDLLGQYTFYCLPHSQDLRGDIFRTFREMFSVTEYLADADNSCRTLLTQMCETQMFSTLLQIRSEGTAEWLQFYEHLASVQRDLGLRAGGHAFHLSASGSTVFEMPVPLVKLFELECRWRQLTELERREIIQNHERVPSGQRKQFKLTSLTLSSLSQLRSLSGQENASQGPTIVSGSTIVTNRRMWMLLVYKDFLEASTGGSSGLGALEVEGRSRSISTSSSLSSASIGGAMSLGSKGSGPGRAEANNLKALITRQELMGTQDLTLRDVDAGPLLLPGPAYNDSMDCSSEENGGGVGWYHYKNGWPSLNTVSLDGSETSFVLSSMKRLRANRLHSLLAVPREMRLLVRTQYERLSLDSISPVKGMVPPLVGVSVNSSLAAALDMAIGSLQMLTLRAMNGDSVWHDLWQILGLLGTLEAWEVFPFLGETPVRWALMVCASTGGDVSRRVARVLLEFVTATGMGVDSLTFGQFCSAHEHLTLSEKADTSSVSGLAMTGEKASASDSSSEYFDGFVHLEELGRAWYVQKSRNVSVSDAVESGSSTAAVAALHHERLVAQKNKPLDISFWLSRLGAPRGDCLLPFGTSIPFVQETAVKLTANRSLLNEKSVVKSTEEEVIESEGTESVSVEEEVTVENVLSAWEAHVCRFGTLCREVVPTTIRRVPVALSKNRRTLLSRDDHSTVSSTPTPSQTPPAPPSDRNAAGGVVSGQTLTPMSMVSKFGNSLSGLVRHAQSPQISEHKTLATATPVPATDTANASKEIPKPESSPFASFTRFLSRGNPRTNPVTPLASTPVPATPSQSEAMTTAATVTASTPVAVSGSAAVTPIATIRRVSTNPIAELSVDLTFEDDLSDGVGSDSESGSHSTSEPSTPNLSIAPPILARSSSIPGESDDFLEVEAEVEAEAEVEIDDEVEADAEVEVDIAISAEAAEKAAKEAAEAEALAFAESEATQICELLESPLENTARMNSRLRTLLRNKAVETSETAGEWRGVTIHSLTHCPSCGLAPLPEELLSRWQLGNSGEFAHGGTHLSSTLINSLDITCGSCNTQFRPCLQVRQIAGSISEPSSVTTLWNVDVVWLSPCALRFSLEELIVLLGPVVNKAAWLARYAPAVYWNHVWYCTRAGLPTGMSQASISQAEEDLLSFASVFRREDFAGHGTSSGRDVSPSVVNAPLAIGWKHTAAEARLRRLVITAPILDDNDPRHLVGTSGLTLLEVFPNLTMEEATIIVDEALPCCTSTPESLLGALQALAKCHNVWSTYAYRTDASDFTWTGCTRGLFVALMTIAIEWGGLASYDVTVKGFNRDLSKECVVIRHLTDCISQFSLDGITSTLLSAANSAQIEIHNASTSSIDKEAIVEWIVDHRANAARAMFGLLL